MSQTELRRRLSAFDSGGLFFRLLIQVTSPAERGFLRAGRRAPSGGMVRACTPAQIWAGGLRLVGTVMDPGSEWAAQVASSPALRSPTGPCVHPAPRRCRRSCGALRPASYSENEAGVGPATPASRACSSRGRASRGTAGGSPRPPRTAARPRSASRRDARAAPARERCDASAAAAARRRGRRSRSGTASRRRGPGGSAGSGRARPRRPRAAARTGSCSAS